jgi:hypothetical protein
LSQCLSDGRPSDYAAGRLVLVPGNHPRRDAMKTRQARNKQRGKPILLPMRSATRAPSFVTCPAASCGKTKVKAMDPMKRTKLQRTIHHRKPKRNFRHIPFALSFIITWREAVKSRLSNSCRVFETRRLWIARRGLGRGIRLGVGGCDLAD